MAVVLRKVYAGDRRYSPCALGKAHSDMKISPDQPLSQDPESQLLWAYKESLRVEKHWTNQVQNQQRRIAAVLAVNGFLLAFLAAGGLQLSAKPSHQWYFYPFSISLILLSIALVFGVLSLWPMIKVAGSKKGARHELLEWLHNTFFPSTRDGFEDKDLWLNSLAIKDRALGPSEDFDRLLRDLCERAAGNADGNLDLRNTMIRRRMFMNWEILFIAVALIVLTIALVGWGVHILTPS